MSLTEFLELPNELLVMILELVSEDDMYFIGSTCTRIYEVYKEKFKEKIQTKISACFMSVPRVIWTCDVMSKTRCKKMTCQCFEMSPAWYKYTAKHGNVDVFKWLDGQGCKKDTYTSAIIALRNGHVDASWHLLSKNIIIVSDQWLEIGKSGSYELFVKYKGFLNDRMLIPLVRGIISNGHVKLMRLLIAEKIIEVDSNLIHVLLSKSKNKMVEIFDDIWESISSYIEREGINIVMYIAAPAVVDWLVRRNPLFASFIQLDFSSDENLVKRSKFSYDTFKAYIETDAFLKTYFSGNLLSYFFKLKWTDLLDICLEKKPGLMSIIEKFMYDCYYTELTLEFVKWCLGRISGKPKFLHVNKDRMARIIIRNNHDDIFNWLLSENLFNRENYLKKHRDNGGGLCYRSNCEFSPHLRLFVKYGVEIDWDVLVKEILNVNGKKSTFKDILAITNEVVILIKLLIENEGDKYLLELQKRLPKLYDNASQIILIYFPLYRIYF